MREAHPQLCKNGDSGMQGESGVRLTRMIHEALLQAPACAYPPNSERSRSDRHADRWIHSSCANRFVSELCAR